MKTNCFFHVHSGPMAQERQVDFEFMLRFLLKLDPTLGTRKITMYSDEDTAFIGAVRKVIPNAFVFICQWHKMRNFSKSRTLRKRKRDEKDVSLFNSSSSDSEKELEEINQ